MDTETSHTVTGHSSCECPTSVAYTACSDELEKIRGRAITKEALTKKQQDFVCSYLETGNASEAYRRAYDAKDMKDSTIHVKASELLSNGKIAVRLDELRGELKERGVLSIETHLGDLKRLRDLAAEAGLYTAAIKAEELRGKIGGFYVERQEVGKPNDFSHMSQEELWRSIEEDMAEFGFVRLKQ